MKIACGRVKRKSAAFSPPMQEAVVRGHWSTSPGVCAGRGVPVAEMPLQHGRLFGTVAVFTTRVADTRFAGRRDVGRTRPLEDLLGAGDILRVLRVHRD